MTYKIHGNKFLLGLASVFFGGAVYLHSSFDKPLLNISKQDSSINVHQNMLRFLSLGNKRLLADLLWIQTLLESDVERYEKGDLKSWMFLRFLSISELDPLFYQNYLYGGQYLSIVKDDLEGAAFIYEKGLKYYPEDFYLNYNAGFNYFFELGDLKKAEPLFSKIVNHPKSPPILFSIVNKMKFEMSFEFNEAINLLQHQLKFKADPVLKHKLEVDLYSLRAERDLDCLNKGKNNCEKTDLLGQPYLYRDGEWKSVNNFVPYRLKINSRKKKGQD